MCRKNTMQRYYFFYITYKDYNGQTHGYWSCRLANNKKEILNYYNPRGRQYSNPVKRVYTKEQALQLAKFDRSLAELIKQFDE